MPVTRSSQKSRRNALDENKNAGNCSAGSARNAASKPSKHIAGHKRARSPSQSSSKRQKPGNDASSERPQTPEAASSASKGEEPKYSTTTPGRVTNPAAANIAGDDPSKPHTWYIWDQGTPRRRKEKGPKNALEKDDIFRRNTRKNPEESFHAIYLCVDRGEDGPSTYDENGFQMDYHKCADWMKPRAYNKKAMVNGMERRVEKAKTEEEKMADIFFEKGAKPEMPPNHIIVVDLWKDRVSKDLWVPFHKVGLDEFKEWEAKGFVKAKKGEYSEVSKQQSERFMGLSMGSRLRK